MPLAARGAAGGRRGPERGPSLTACCKAVSEGHRSFRRIAIYADSESWCTPCGACRQFLAEFSPDMEVLCAKAGDRYVSYKLSELLPHGFNY